MKALLFIIGLVASTYCIAQNSISEMGEKSPNVHHVGDVWLKELSAADSADFTFAVAVASFAKGSYLYWHSHPAGQVLIVTEGEGFYQEKGKPKQTVKKGDVIKCGNVLHWHGSTPDSAFTYIATTPTQKGRTVWAEKVSDQEYRAK